MRERLRIQLVLTCGGSKHEIPGANIRFLSLELRTWGGEGTVEFVVQDDQALGGKYSDELCPDFAKPSLMSVQLRLESVHTDTESEPSFAPLLTSGIVSERSVTEQIWSRQLGEPSVLMRRYRIRFLDPARAWWKGHFPCGLHTKASLKSVIEAHKGTRLNFEYDWEALEAEVPQIFYQLSSHGSASYYDWVIGCLAERGGHLLFDHSAERYRLCASKPEPDASGELRREEIRELTAHFCDPVRYYPRIRNSYAEEPRSVLGTNPNAEAGLYSDVMLATPIGKDVDDAVASTNAAVCVPRQELHLSLAKYPSVALIPGAGVTVPALQNGSPELLSGQLVLRVVSLSLSATNAKDAPDIAYGEPDAAFSASMDCVLEDASDATPHLPVVPRPNYPGHLEGKIVCTVGEEKDITYDYATDDERSISAYRVRIPLFEDQEVLVPFEPTTGTSNLYFPLYKDQRVLVALNLSNAWIERLLEWRPELLTAKERQGQQLIFGKSKENCTSLLHDYDGEKPVLQLLRTNKKDSALLRLEEGKLLLKVEEQKD
ncbi:MAG TPA: hypothetical protein VIV60_06510 [Polyangiaceae bacterium]